MNKILKSMDPILLVILTALFLIALLSLYSASHRPDGDMIKNFAFQQLIWMAFAIFASAFIIWFGYERCIDYGYTIFAINIAFLLLVLLVGSTKLGARRWLSLGLFNLQPSEFCKVSFILALVKYIDDRRNSLNSTKVFFTSLLMSIVPIILIIQQPDLGTAVVFLPVLCVVLFVAGTRMRYLIYFFLTAMASFPILWHILKDYQKKRLLVFLNPDLDPLGAGYTVIQSKIAVGSGGIFGRGWLSGTQNQLNFLPERHTDFIFSVIGEEWGLLGALFVLALFLLMIRQLLMIANGTYDLRGRLLVVGIVALFWFQIFVNIAMTIGLMPVVGLPLPFISYGGSSLMMTMMLIMLAMSVRSKRKIF